MIELTLQHEHEHQDKHPSQPEEENEEESQHQSQNLDHVPCHPHRPVSNFDFTSIEEQIRIIRLKKQAAKEAARQVRKIQKTKNQIYESDLIQQILEESIESVPEHVSMSIKHRLKFIEDKVFISAQNETYGDLVARIKQQVLSNQALANELNLVMAEVQCDIENDIQEGSYDIHKIVRKHKIIPVQQEPAHRLKLKNMLIKNKLADLREDINKSQIAGSDSLISASIDASRLQRKEGQIWGDEFHLLSEGTKKAHEFVKKIRKQQLLMRRERSRKAEEMKSLEVKSAMEHKQFEEQMKKEKHESLKKRYQQERQQKKTEKQKQEEQQKNFLRFLKEFKGKKPLFRIKQEQYLKNVVQQQEKKRKMQLQEIRNAKRPVTKEELLEHEQNYLKFKQSKQAQQAAEREMRKKQEASLPRKSFYRGRFHSLIKQEEEQRKIIIDPNVARDALLRKQKQFGELIRKKYSPHISEAKRKQLQELITSLENEGSKKNVSQTDYKRLGNQYLKQLHKMMDQFKSKGLIKSKISEQISPKKKDYLRQVREKYNLSTIDYSQQVDANEQWVKNKAQKCQKDARNKEKVLKLKDIDNFDIELYMRELEQINNNYINSAEAKISLINKLEGKPLRRSVAETSRNSSEYEY